MKKVVEVSRKTGETQVRMKLALQGPPSYQGKVPIGFLDHMLHLLSFHGGLALKVEAEGDLHVDDHHLTEDCGIVLGKVLDQALGDRSGIQRYGFCLLPMDEVLVAAALDLGGRAFFHSNYRSQREQVGGWSTELVVHFFSSLAFHARMTLHLQVLEEGVNEHHRIEALFKAFGRALRMALQPDDRLSGRVPSTKGAV